jgi:hypothetical protein
VKITVFDEIAETDGDNEWKAWLEKVFTSRDEIVTLLLVTGKEVVPERSFVIFGVLLTSISVSDSVIEDRTPLFGSQNRDIAIAIL